MNSMSSARVCLSTQAISRSLKSRGQIELIVDIMTIPPHTKFSRQRQEGEELAYVLEGFLVLHHDDRPDEFYKKGDAGKLPLLNYHKQINNQVHRVSTQEEGATILVFSVNARDKP